MEYAGSKEKRCIKTGRRDEREKRCIKLEVAEASTKAAAAAGVTVYGPGAAYLQLFFRLQVLLKKEVTVSARKYILCNKNSVHNIKTKVTEDDQMGCCRRLSACRDQT